MTPDREEPTLLQKHWDRYLANRDDIESRDFILLSYQPLVEKIASRLIRKRPPTVDRRDLVQAGMIGLQHALERYDPDQGALFSTFATQRVRGSILDEINSLDWTPRLVRERIKAVLRASEEHYRVSQRPPTAEELSKIIAHLTGKAITPEQVDEALHQSTKTYVHAVDNAMAVQHEENSRFESVGTQGGAQGSDVETHVIEKKFFEDAVNEAVAAVCTPQEKVIIEGVFFQEKSMKALAAELSVPVSRIATHKKSAIAKIKDHLHAQGVTSVDHW